MNRNQDPQVEVEFGPANNIHGFTDEQVAALKATAIPTVTALARIGGELLGELTSGVRHPGIGITRLFQTIGDASHEIANGVSHKHILYAEAAVAKNTQARRQQASRAESDLEDVDIGSGAFA